jgi:predicted amidohydrolase
MIRISIIQPDLLWEDKPGNFRKIEGLLTEVNNNADIVVLPEMFNTGFSMNTGKMAEPFRSVTFRWMTAMAEKGNFGLCGSYTVKDNNLFYNRWVFVTPEKKSWFYDKRHLFRMADENKHFTPGKNQLFFTFRGVRIFPGICYDLRFPVWNRNRNNYDLYINSANWPESRSDVWITLLKARALENQCFVIGCNRVGTDGNGVSYSGDSIIINPRGEMISSDAGNEESRIDGEISLNDIEEFRRKFPVFEDADDFTLNL